MTPKETNAMQRQVLLTCAEELKTLAMVIEEVTMKDKFPQYGDEDVEAWFNLLKEANARKFINKFFQCNCNDEGCGICYFYEETLPIKIDV